MSKNRKLLFDINSICAHVTMEQVLEHYHLLNNFKHFEHDLMKGRCPIHIGTDDTHFLINTRKNLWVCSKCLKGGSVLDFVRLKESAIPIKYAALLISIWFDLPQRVRLETHCFNPTTVV
jgi:hypothetical protein